MKACCCKLLDLMSFPVDANAKRPNPNKQLDIARSSLKSSAALLRPRKATFRQKENPVVLYLYQGCDEAGGLFTSAGSG